MKKEFLFSFLFGIVWLSVSIWFSIQWGTEISHYLPAVYVWLVIIGIALLPGFLMSSMFFSNLLHQRLRKYPHTDEPTTVIMCAHNEEQTITKAIACVLSQTYKGPVRLLVIDNCSTDHTKDKIMKAYCLQTPTRTIEYIFCDIPGKTHALNCGLALVCTQHFITVDADTFLEKNAIQRIMDHIVAESITCTAGNLFVKNVKSSIFTKMQNYDYLLSIAAVKRFQGSYHSTLVAQGAFSAYRTDSVRALGGWKNCLGEDIVLTYQLLEQGNSSTYEPRAVGYTTVPHTLNSFYNQRKRWAIGMLEGFSEIKPWQQGSFYSRYFTFVNISIIYLDFAYLFGFVPGVLLALFGYYYFAGFLTLFTLIISILLFSSVYIYQKKLKIPFQNSFGGFVCFLFFFQLIQSSAALHGYITKLLKRSEVWK